MGETDALETIQRSQRPDGRPFDPTRTALVQQPALPSLPSFGDGPATVTVERVEDGRIALATKTAGGGFLVLSETFYPGWQARVDGRPVEIFRTNVALQGIVVPSGTARVEFEFQPRSQFVGAIVSGIGGMTCLLLLAFEWRSGRRQPA
jgi:hypothetical protein